ncbi:MAG: hypothetical protein Q4E76_05825 [Tissierellia bacterium]|nr:hypothetical protein [Tissierellia bacterium]
MKRVLLGAVVLGLGLVLGLFFLLLKAHEPTAEGKRINTDTQVRMLVDLPHATPSRAITFTTARTPGEKGYEAKLSKYRERALGRVEGDIPSLQLSEDAQVILRFQDLHHNNISPERVEGVEAQWVDVLSEEEKPTHVPASYTLAEGAIVLDAAQFPYQRHGEEGKIWTKLILTADYQYQGEDYTSVTAVLILDK